MSRFNPFPPVGDRYGAPMGRASGQIPTDLPANAYAVSRPQGEYDSGGAYWGTSRNEGPVYAVWVRGAGRDGVAYVRAKSAQAALAAVLEG